MNWYLLRSILGNERVFKLEVIFLGMFSNRICSKCGKKLKGGFNFCPYCGSPIEEKTGDFGMLGRNDIDSGSDNIVMPKGLNIIFNSLLRNLEKQLREPDKKSEKSGIPKGSHISISISTTGNGMPLIKLRNSQEERKKKQEEVKRFFFNNFNSKKLNKYSKLPKVEPKTNIRRVSNKIVYEVELPGVKSAKDISIVSLERSMELKAISDKKAYTKTIPINLPISNYSLSRGKLILEMDTPER